MSKYGVFSGLYFPAYGLSTERYRASLRNQSEFGKIRTRQNSVFGFVLGDCSTFYGTLVLKFPSSLKKDSLYYEEPAVFATKKSTFLKKHGDVFKIHIPGILKNASRDTISFESMRWPDYYLQRRQLQNESRFHIAKRTNNDRNYGEFHTIHCTKNEVLH